MTAPASRGVIITGGAAGIGQATALRLATQGDQIAILDRDGPAAEATAASLGEGHVAIEVDVSDQAALVAAIGEARRQLGRIDVLVANAATIFSGGGPALDLDPATWRRFVAVNAAGVYDAAREGVRLMRAQGSGGAIVTLASLAGVVAVPANTGYSASKAAVIGLTRSLARDCQADGIRINAVLPGFTATESLRAVQRARAADTSLVERRIPLGRMAEPDEIAGAVQHLASHDASATHGALLAVDGGFNIYGGAGDAAAPGATRPAPPRGARVALISGATSAFGAAIAERLAGSGAAVVPVDATGTVRDAVARFGRVDLLVNAAAEAPADLSPGFDNEVVRALALAQAAAPAMFEAGGGTIVNLCAAPGGGAGRAAAREMMAMLSRSLACEWARHCVRVNAVIPGAPTTAAGVAAAVDFLAGRDASYVTGATYVADGGADLQRS